VQSHFAAGLVELFLDTLNLSGGFVLAAGTGSWDGCPSTGSGGGVVSAESIKLTLEYFAAGCFLPPGAFGSTD